MSLFPRSVLTRFSRLSLARSALPGILSDLSPIAANVPLFQPSTSSSLQIRNKMLFPRKVRYRRPHKGRIPLSTGGSTRGTTLAFGDFGIRANIGVRVTAKHIDVCEQALKRMLKPYRGCKIYFRIFPDLAVCVKGNETRMGKGKGTFEYWAARVKTGAVVLEIGGPNLRSEIAHAVLKIAAAKLPTTCQIIDRSAKPRIGYAEFDRIPDVKPKIITVKEYREAKAQELAAAKSGAPSLALLSSGSGSVPIQTPELSLSDHSPRVVDVDL